MRYFDTSFLAPLVLQESTSRRVERFVTNLAGELAVSQWTRIEFSSLLAREVRMGGLDAPSAHRANEQFDALVRESFTLLLPTSADYELARNYLGNYAKGLRAGDALHLAIATNNSAEVTYSFDNVLLKAGRLLGIAVSLGIRAAPR